MMPRVSIVLPTYNRAKLLPRAVESCLTQTFRELEVIIVDDGSTDETASTARRIAEGDSRVRFLSKPNAGLPSALNTGFFEATGDFFTWTSDDNRYHPVAISAMVGELERHPECSLVYTDFQLVDEKGVVRQKVQNRPPEDLPGINVVGPCFLYRRSAADEAGGYDLELKYVEDWDYWLRIALVSPIRHLPGIYYDFLDHEGSLTRQRQLDVLEAELKMRRITSDPEARKEWRCAAVARRLATLHWAAGNHLRAILYRLGIL